MKKYYELDENGFVITSSDCKQDDWYLLPECPNLETHYWDETVNDWVEDLRFKNILDAKQGIIEAENELKALDYIGTKIATGRATKEEYEQEITRMKELANRINELEEIINYNTVL